MIERFLDLFEKLVDLALRYVIAYEKRQGKSSPSTTSRDPIVKQDVYSDHGFQEFLEDPEISTSIAIVIEDASLFVPANPDAKILNLEVNYNKDLKIKKGSIISVFNQPWDVTYDGDNLFLEYVGFKGEVHRNTYIRRDKIDWIHRTKGRL